MANSQVIDKILPNIETMKNNVEMFNIDFEAGSNVAILSNDPTKLVDG